MNGRWSGILAGAVVVIGCEMLLLMLGTAIGLSVLPTRGENWSALGWGAVLFMLVAVFLSYYVGGFVTGRLNRVTEPGENCFQGLAMWGTVCCAMLLFVSTALTNFVSTVGAGATGVTFLSELKESRPRVVVDLQSEEGKAIATFESDDLKSPAAANVPGGTDAEQNRQTAKKAAAGGGWGLFLTLLLAAIGATLGTYSGRPRRDTAAPVTIRRPVAA